MPANTVAEFEMAVLCAFQYASASLQDQQAQVLKQQAETFCNAIKASADGWRYELELFEFSEHQEVKFYALQALQVRLRVSICHRQRYRSTDLLLTHSMLYFARRKR